MKVQSRSILAAARRQSPHCSRSRAVRQRDDVLVYIREHRDESVLLAAARADFDLTLADTSFAGIPKPLFGDAEAAGLGLHGHGPSFTAWALPGVSVP